MDPTKILNQLKSINWDKDTVPLVNFLNLTQEELEAGYKGSEFALELSLSEILSLHDELSFVLESLLEEKNKEQVEALLTRRWLEATHFVEVVGKRVFTGSYSNIPLRDIWVNFIAGTLYREWWKRMARCLFCKKWFYRAKSDRIYCSKACKNRADYYKHQDRRTEGRKERYRIEKDYSDER